jgi:hypothetical protein
MGNLQEASWSVSCYQCHSEQQLRSAKPSTEGTHSLYFSHENTMSHHSDSWLLHHVSLDSRHHIIPHLWFAVFSWSNLDDFGVLKLCLVSTWRSNPMRSTLTKVPVRHFLAINNSGASAAWCWSVTSACFPLQCSLSVSRHLGSGTTRRIIFIKRNDLSSLFYRSGYMGLGGPSTWIVGTG